MAMSRRDKYSLRSTRLLGSSVNTSIEARLQKSREADARECERLHALVPGAIAAERVAVAGAELLQAHKRLVEFKAETSLRLKVLAVAHEVQALERLLSSG